MHKTLETDRLILRGWRREDLNDLHEYAKNPSMAMGGWKPHANKRASLRALKSFIKEDDRWAIVLKENDEVIGQLRLHPDKNRGQFSARNSAYAINYALSEDYWGNGYMTEAVKRVISYAFDEMHIELLGVSHYPHNDRSRRVIERCGFHYDGIIENKGRKNVNGQVFDGVCYSILRRRGETMQMRPANTNDIPVLVELRKRQLMDEGEGVPSDHHLVHYFTAAMADGSFAAWVMEEQGEIAATGAACFYALPPTFSNPTGRVAYVTNMYTKNEYRRRGAATALLGMAIGEAKARGCGVVRLHASEDGRPIYRKAGFVDSDGYMMRKL